MRQLRTMALLCLMSSLPPLSIDMGLPAMGAIQTALGGTARDQELLLSIFMAGFALTPLLYGALSDRLGRKPALTGGLALFTLAGLVCTMAHSMGVLLTARFFQGSGAGAGVTLAFAITRDLFEGPKLGVRLSVIAMVVNTGPIIAPSLGALMLGFTGWRGIYGVLAGLGALTFALSALFLPETRPKTAAARAGVPGAIAALWRRPAALGYIGLFGANFGAIFAYIASSSLLLIGHFHVSAYEFALLFAMTASGIVSGAFVSGQGGRMFGHQAMIAAGLALTLGGPAVIGALLLLGRANLALIMAALVAATFGNGLVTPAASQRALSPFPAIAGLVGALLTTTQMGCSALSSGVAALLVNRWGIGAIPAVMLLFALASLACALSTTRREVQAQGV